jgi:hypothetical protein
MGTVHTFKRPPNNERQFRGYRSRTSTKRVADPAPPRKLRAWQRSALTWLMLVVLAVGLWAAGALIGNV